MVKKAEASESVKRAIALTDNVVEASNLLQEWAQKDAELYNHLTQPFLGKACYAAVTDYVRHDRRQVWTAPNYSKAGNGGRVREHARSLLDFPLPGGKRLRDAKRSDLEEAARFYGEQADDMAHKARWFKAIADRIGRKRVENALSVEDLEQLKEEASC